MAVHVLFFISQNYSVQIFFLYPLFSPRPPNFLSTFLRTARMMSACVASVFAAPDHHHLRTDAAQLIALPRPVLASQSFQTILIPPSWWSFALKQRAPCDGVASQPHGFSAYNSQHSRHGCQDGSCSDHAGCCWRIWYVPAAVP